MTKWKFLIIITLSTLYLGLTCISKKSQNASIYIPAYWLKIASFFNGNFQNGKYNIKTAAYPSKEALELGKSVNGKPIILNDNNKKYIYLQSNTTKQPKIYKGLYLNNYTSRKTEAMQKLIDKGKQYGVNAFVADIQPRMPSADNVKQMKNAGIYSIARLVCFDQGLRRIRPSKNKMKKLYAKAIQAAKLGFDEIQLDYIRYADGWGRKKIKLKKRYAMIDEILFGFKKVLAPYKIRLGADVFGRIPFNKGDYIGQKLENFAKRVEVIYPMLYPSHFYGDKHRLSHPYDTLFEGVSRSVERMKADPLSQGTKIVAYIQSFNWHTKPAKMSFTNYVYRQIVASERAGSGWISWNARNDYSGTWKALEKIKNHGFSLAPSHKVKKLGYQPKIAKK